MHGIGIYFVGYCAIDRVWQKAAMKVNQFEESKKTR